MLLLDDESDLGKVMPNYPKDYEAFETGVGFCYIPEEGDIAYARQDFLKLVNGDERRSRWLFDAVTWEHPETILDQDADFPESEQWFVHATV